MTTKISKSRLGDIRFPKHDKHLKQQYDQALSDGDIKKALHIKLQIEDIEGKQHKRKMGLYETLTNIGNMKDDIWNL